MDHVFYMRRALQLAANGLGTTYPNPLVGCVIVHKDTIIGEGWHRKAGLPHAEVVAMESVADTSLLRESTLYVNLEPCSHFGKTPPCADKIVEMGIPQVVICNADPNPLVAGNGIEKLKAAGTDVRVGICEAEGRELNRRFFTFHEKKRPYVILKWAESSDGFLSPVTKAQQAPVWISGTESRQLVHKWRSEETAILVGTQTAICDNPRLGVRDWQGKSPVRAVIDRRLEIPENAHLFDNQIKTLVFCEKINHRERENIAFEVVDFSRDIVPQILDTLYRHGLLSVIIEGGAKTLQSFIDGGVWDEARIFKGAVSLAGGTGAPSFRGNPVEIRPIGNDVLFIYRA
jgi:diaminohydroxyphosphoribosylaminopyrimidine deaminase/5-amino-6-(5-phosphoribosylamino)uracil reductase